MPYDLIVLTVLLASNQSYLKVVTVIQDVPNQRCNELASFPASLPCSDAAWLLLRPWESPSQAQQCSIWMEERTWESQEVYRVRWAKWLYLQFVSGMPRPCPDWLSLLFTLSISLSLSAPLELVGTEREMLQTRTNEALKGDNSIHHHRINMEI